MIGKLIIVCGAALCICSQVCAEQTLVAAKVVSDPVVDGIYDPLEWQGAQPITTYEPQRETNVTVRAVYTDTKIFFLVQWADADESREHKTLLWDTGSGRYIDGPEREDVCALKWNMEVHPVDLSIFADNYYRADIWFWKACRTDPMGYADDKQHIISDQDFSDSRRIISKNGSLTYLSRPGDEGTEAYEAQIYTEHVQDRMPKYKHVMPTGSRADIRAKGIWKDGQWTVEFARLLDTEHDDDIMFRPVGQYGFGISCYEMAGREPDPSLTQPLYGSGDVSEKLLLVFEE